MSTEVRARFRDAMAGVCSPVVVVTSRDGDRPHGTTVSAFMSLSMSPPMVAVALDEGSDLLAVVREHRRFAINILSAVQGHLALTFARKGSAKFEGVAWADEAGVPVIDDVAGWVTCDVAELIPGGDHTVVFGTVTGVDAAGRAPLTYHARTFGTHLPHPESGENR